MLREIERQFHVRMSGLRFKKENKKQTTFEKRFEPTDILFSGATTADNAYAFRVLGLDKLSYLFNLGPSLG